MEFGRIASARFTHSFRSMGVISDRLREQLTEMRARHAVTDRQTVILIQEAYELIAETQAMFLEERPQ